jgi:predicted nucleotidyltransferase
MIEYQEIEAYAQELVAKFKPEKVVLFGSYANGSANEDSDIDLLVIMSHLGKASQQALQIRKAVSKRFPLDLVVQSPFEANRRMQAGDPFITNALMNGRVLYGHN